MSELHDLTALEQAAAIRTREISAVELAEHYLARTEALNDTVGAFITVTPEIAQALGLQDEKGALIAQIVPNGPAADRLQPGDVIRTVDGKPVDELRELR